MEEYSRNLSERFTAELLGDLSDNDAELPNRAPVDHRSAIGLEIHVLSHADVEERISRL